MHKLGHVLHAILGGELMKNIIILAALFTFMMNFGDGIPSANAAQSVKVLKNFIKIGSVKYRRAGAESTEIGSIGEKLTPLSKVPRFDRQFGWISGPVKVNQVTTVEISSEQRNALGGKITVLKGIGGTMSAIAFKSKNERKLKGKGGGSVKANYKLVKLEFNDNFDVVNRLNKDKKALKRIKSLKKKKVRIVSAVWILVWGTETQTEYISGKLSGSGSKEAKSGPYSANQSQSGSVNLKRSGSSTFSFSRDTVMAYQLDKFIWDKKNKKKKKIKKLKTDQVWR